MFSTLYSFYNGSTCLQRVYTNEIVSIFNKPQFIIYYIELYTSFLHLLYRVTYILNYVLHGITDIFHYLLHRVIDIFHHLLQIVKIHLSSVSAYS